MLKNIRNSKLSLLNFRRGKLNKASSLALALLVLLNALMFGLSYYKHTIYQTLAFLNFNGIQIVVVILIASIVFYNTYKFLMKTKPDYFAWFVYLISILVFTLNIIGINTLIEKYTGRGFFSLSNYSFIFLSLLPLLFIISNFDFPLIENFNKFINAFKENVYKNLGLYLFIAFLIAFVGLQNKTFIYSLSIIPFVINVYLIKTLLSNVRK